MGLLNYSVTLTAGANENVNDVQTMFNEVKSVLNGNIDTANIAAGGVAAADLATAVKRQAAINDGSSVYADFDFIGTLESTTSTTWTNLATVGPSITLNVPDGGDGFGIVQIYARCGGNNSLFDDSGKISYIGLHEPTDMPISGAISDTIMGLQLDSATGSAVVVTDPGGDMGFGGNYLSTGSPYSRFYGGWLTMLATPGTRTYTLKYAVTGGSGSYFSRYLIGRTFTTRD